MTTVAETIQPQAPAEDPWRYGWRYVRQVGPDGNERDVQVPLTERDILFPREEDTIVANNAHDLDVGYLRGVFDNRLSNDPGGVVLGDKRVDFDVPGVEPLLPDVVVFRGCRRKLDRWPTFYVREEGGHPVLVVEITSPESHNNDLIIKPDFYYRAGVDCYVIVDERMKQGIRRLQLLAWRHTPNGWEVLPLDARGRLWLEPFQLWLAVVPADQQVPFDRVVCIDANGREIRNWNEETQARAEAEANLARLRGEAEAKQREDARARAEAEAQRDEALERLRALEAELRRLRGDS